MRHVRFDSEEVSAFLYELNNLMFVLMLSAMCVNLFIGSQRRQEPKQVIFSDGIRPGGDLTELDGSNKASSRLPLRRSTRNQKRVEKSSAGKFL